MFLEDFSIEVSELVLHWRAEGLIDEQQNYVDSVNRGIALIENLKDSCLLEDGSKKGTVKMHDVVRDVAIWITSSSEDGCKSLVRSGFCLSEISVGEFSNSLKRVSFMNSHIKSLPNCLMQCPEVSTLLLQGSCPFEEVPERFLLGFETLKVLNLSRTNIRSLPVSIIQLGNLYALFLRHCKYIEVVSLPRSLSKLQILDLCGTSIKELLGEIVYLSSLRQLDLSYTRKLKTIRAGIIFKLSCLEVLDVTNSSYQFLVKGEEEGETTFEELIQLDGLLVLSIKLKSIPLLSSDDLSWINGLRRFQILIGPTAYTFLTTHDKSVAVSKIDFTQDSILQLWDISNSLVLKNCSNLNLMLDDLVINTVVGFIGLKSLTIERCTIMKSCPVRGLAACCDLLPNLEELTLGHLNGIKSISELFGQLGLRFLKLKSIEVRDSSEMKYLLSCGDIIQALPNLEVIKVSFCWALEELFNYDSGQNMASDPVVPKLQTLQLEDLFSLRTLGRHEEIWPCLEEVTVFRCNCLRRLPFTIQNTGTIKEIKGESEWWDALLWDDDETKTSLLPYFHPVLR